MSQAELFDDGKVAPEQYVGRKTNPGKLFEKLIGNELIAAGFSVRSQVVIGTRLGGTKHKVDFVITAADRKRVAISVKWQAERGTGEDKMPFEVMSLVDAVRDGTVSRAYIVCGGNGWTPKRMEAYLDGKLAGYVKDAHLVPIIDRDTFTEMVFRRKL